jgi:transitional endoplasmic reticulum ATPase
MASELGLDFQRQLFDGLITTLGQKNTQQAQLQNDALAALDALGSKTVKEDGIVFEGTRIVLPAQFDGNLLAAAKFLQDQHKAEEEEFEFGRAFKYRMWDGAAAFDRSLYRVFGSTGFGKATQTFFGPQPPKRISISVSPTQTLQVPWGDVSMPLLDAVFTLGGTYDEEYGQLFYLSVVAPKKRRRALEGFFDVVEDELKQRSIYKGKAFNGAESPEFLDLSKLDESKVVYSDDVLHQLDANLWGLIKHTDTMVKLGIPLKRAVLLEGPYGTGKSLAGALTAKRAEENGWTFILARPGKDNVFEVLNTAKLYAPAVVQFEDIDTIAAEGTDKEISRLLDALDGISNKTNGVLALFTTNHVKKLQKGVMRPGRIDSIIHIADLDRNGIERAIRANVDSSVLGNLDYDVVFAEMEGFLPAFVVEAVNRAVRYAVTRNGGHAKFTIETEDVIRAAQGLRRQLDLMNEAQEGNKAAITMDDVFGKQVADTVTQVIEDKFSKVGIYNAYDGDREYNLKVQN